MPNYYNIVRGNLLTGEIAKSSDINHIQRNIMDMINNYISDEYDNEAFMLGSGEEHKNDFLLYPAQKFQGRYVDDRIVPDAGETTIDLTKYININRYSVRQPITITKTSIYSVIVKLKNESNRNIEVRFELQEPDETVLRANTLTIPANTNEPKDFEVVFDLDYYPTAPNLEHDDIKEKDGRDIVPRHLDEESYDEGFIYDPDDDEIPQSQLSMGVSQLYFVINKTDLNEKSLVEMDTQDSTPVSFDPETSLGVFYTESSPNSEKDIYCEIASENIFTSEKKMNIFFKEVYANGMTYLCKGGEAVIRGERTLCLDTHISIAGGNSYGNMLTAVYMDKTGRLYARNYKASLTTDINSFEEDEPIIHSDFPVGLIFTYSNVYGLDKEPIVIQKQSYDQLPLSHHERLRRIEKHIDWIDDVAIPARLKWTLTGEDLVDKEGANPAGYPYGKADSKDSEASKYYLTTDANGNPVVRLSEAVVTTIPITLKDAEKDSDGNKITLEENDVKNASYFSEIKDMTHDVKTGKITLKNANSDLEKQKVALTDKDAKKTKFNPWDDDKSNRPADAKFKKIEREFTVYSGKNGTHDTSSEFPAMTLYCDKKIKLTKLTIPIHKFKNCSGIKFYIWKRQSSNNRKNVVNHLEKKIWTSKVFSLKKAKVKNDYQYMDEGFTLEFENGGLSLPKAQYAIICLPIPKSKEGSCFVETFEPKKSRDFLIRYHGAANASHFTLKTRYHEVWYNAATGEAIEEEYPKKGSIVSKTITWSEEGLKNIETIRPVIDKNLTIPDKTTAKIFADTGGGWQELTRDKDNDMVGGATSFKWKIEFTSDGKSTPELKYDSKKKYAIQFILTRAKAGTSNASQVEEKDKNMCITTTPFDGNKILKEYVGDSNLGNKFNQFEFARIWTDETDSKKMLIDIQGSDKDYKFEKTGNTYPLWSLHYCDLTLDDFSKMNVDYSDYEEDVEYDENNLRLKLDSNHSYNDNDIAISSLQDFKKVTNAIDSSESSVMTFINNSNVTTNQIFLKSEFANPKDLTQYTGLIFKFRMRASDASILKGLGIYISNNLNPQPTQIIENEYIEELEDTEVLPPIIDPDISSESYYEGKTIKLIHYIDKDNDGNKAYETGYYKYVPQYDNYSKKIIYVLQQIHDLKDYKIYEIKELKYDDSKAITPEDEDTDDDVVVENNGTPVTGTPTGNDTPAGADAVAEDNSEEDSEDKITKTKYMEITVRIEIDQDSQVLKTVREIGIISLHDESKYSVSTENSGNISLELEEVKALSEDYYPIFNPEKDTGLWTSATEYATVYDYNNLTLTAATFDNQLDDKDLITTALGKMKSTSPVTEQICIDYQGMEEKNTQICYMNNPYDGGLSKYKHLGIQMASDVYIPKDCLKLQLCEKENGESPFVTVNLPTLNTVYDPINGDKAVKTINLSKIFKKINSDKPIKSINVVATKHFKAMLKDIVAGEKGDHVNIFLGKIVVYKAETIPMFHNKMRFKLYSVTNGEINHSTETKTSKSISVRKIGTVVDYS